MKNKKIVFSLLVILGIIGIIPKSYGAISIRPSTTADASRVSVNSSITNSYMVCQQMKNNGESLYGTQLKPHMATNTDWGAVSYFSNSVYGTNTGGQNTGIIKNINGVDYYSTNGNETGVMNWGSNPYKTLYTQTAGITKTYMDLTDTTVSEAHDNVISLETAAKSNSDYVEIINMTYLDQRYFSYSGTLGMGMAETLGIYSSWKTFQNPGTYNYPISLRQGLFGFGISIGAHDGTPGVTFRFRTNGANYSDVTFRPVVYN